MFIDRCKEEIGITVELKDEFQNSIFYRKKNRFIARMVRKLINQL